MRPQCTCSCAGGFALALVGLVGTTLATRLPDAGSSRQLPFVLSNHHGSAYSVPSAVQHAHVATSSSHGPLHDGETSLSLENEVVIRIDVSGLSGEAATKLLRTLEARDLDIWQKKKDLYFDVRLSADQADEVSALVVSLGAPPQVIVESVGALIAEERMYQRAAFSSISTASHAALMSDPDTGLHALYHPYPAVESLLQLFATDYPDFTRLENIGQSAEGRAMWSLKVSDYRRRKADEELQGENTWRTLSRAALKKLSPLKRAKKPKHKLGFALLGGQHAREWISPAALLHVAHALLASTHNTDSTYRQSDQAADISTFLSDYELHIIPIANPDGYVYSWEHDRLWVRSRQQLASNGTRCHGIDLNRNWAYKFDKPYRPNPCSDLYPGMEPFEAVELQTISRYLKGVKETSRLDVFLDLHSFGQLIMYPYSYSCSVAPPNAENLFEGLLRASKAMKEVHKQNYEVGGACDVSYVATGQSLDWTYHELGAKWSFAANLRDQGVHAFLLPPDQIIPTGQELLAGILDLAKFIAQKEKIED